LELGSEEILQNKKNSTLLDGRQTSRKTRKHLYLRDEGNIRPIEKCGAGSPLSEAHEGGWEGLGEDGGEPAP